MLLPPLITLSNDLMVHLERCPTAAGVGASFRSVADQLEATFIGWSFTVADTMARLRSIELLVPSRAPVHRRSIVSVRIGLVFVPPADDDHWLDQSSSRNEGTPLATVPPPPPPPSLSSSPNQPSRTNHLTSNSTSDLVSSPSGDTRDITSPCTTAYHPTKTKRSSKKVSSSVARPTAAPPCSPQLSQHRSPLVSGGNHRGQALSPLDIVIMPTQRLPRYLLLLRQLQSHTPKQSVAYARLEHAWGVCRRVADLCDGASAIA